MVHRVFLVPGFFGFANLGDLPYFAHVSEAIQTAFHARGARVIVHRVTTAPTASIRRRAAALCDSIAEHDDGGPGPIHLIGHSTGGLDARLLVTPSASLDSQAVPAEVAARVRTVISVATPHTGAPLAALFTSVLGHKLLELLSLTTLHGIRLGSVPIPAVLAIAGLLRGGGALERPVTGMLDQLFDQVLGDFNAERQGDIAQFIHEVGGDQALLTQLSPAAMDLFNAAVADRPGVRYGSVIAMAPPPTLGHVVRIGLSPHRQAMHALFRGLHRLAGQMPDAVVQRPTPSQVRALRSRLGRDPEQTDNDAIVPTLAQVWGQVVYAAHADHLDVIGHFDDAGHDPPHIDWLTTESHFKRQQFDALWDAVAAFMIE